MNGFTIFLFTSETGSNINWDSIILSSNMNKEIDVEVKLNKELSSFALSLNKQLDTTVEK